jgi:L-arabinonolactonase
MTHIRRVEGVNMQWGESVRWDDRRQRLYFVDCAERTLHWLDRAEPPLRTLPLPGLPTGLVLSEDGRLVVALDDGLHVVDVDAGSTELLTPYPEELGMRANDANADLDGNLVTGTLNLAPGPGGYWWYSATKGWRRLDDGIGNANGPVVLESGGGQTLVFADTHASTLYAYDYEGAIGTASGKRVYAETSSLGGMPDGACADGDGGVWTCILAAGLLARVTADGIQETIETGVEQPSDVTFGGPDLDRIFFTSIALPVTVPEIRSDDAGALMVVEGSGHRGRVEPRFKL